MIRKRQTGRTQPDYDRKTDFSAPDGRRSAGRTAAHRYIPGQDRLAYACESTAADPYEFRARWWPAPELRP